MQVYIEPQPWRSFSRDVWNESVRVDPEEELLFGDFWEDETQREVVIETLKADFEVRTGTPLVL